MGKRPQNARCPISRRDWIEKKRKRKARRKEKRDENPYTKKMKIYQVLKKFFKITDKDVFENINQFELFIKILEERKIDITDFRFLCLCANSGSGKTHFSRKLSKYLSLKDKKNEIVDIDKVHSFNQGKLKQGEELSPMLNKITKNTDTIFIIDGSYKQIQNTLFKRKDTLVIHIDIPKTLRLFNVIKRIYYKKNFKEILKNTMNGEITELSLSAGMVDYHNRNNYIEEVQYKVVPSQLIQLPNDKEPFKMDIKKVELLPILKIKEEDKERIKNKVIEYFNQGHPDIIILGILLFGSWVHGTAHEKSDYDVVVIFDNTKLDDTNGFQHEIDGNIDIHGYSHEMYFQSLNDMIEKPLLSWISSIRKPEFILYMDEKIKKEFINFDFKINKHKLRVEIKKKLRSEGIGKHGGSSKAILKIKKEEDYDKGIKIFQICLMLVNQAIILCKLDCIHDIIKISDDEWLNPHRQFNACVQQIPQELRHSHEIYSILFELIEQFGYSSLIEEFEILAPTLKKQDKSKKQGKHKTKVKK